MTYRWKFKTSLWTFFAILQFVEVGGSRNLPRRAVSVYRPYCTFDNDVIFDDEKFEKRVRESEYVFTGKIVSKVEHVVSEGSVRFTVAVRRDIKGGPNGEVLVKLKLREGEGSECKLVVRHRYTAIFLARLSETSGDRDIYELTIRPVPFSLHNLERVNKAVKGNYFYSPVTTNNSYKLHKYII